MKTILMIKPDHSSGNEDVKKYFKQYEKASDVTGGTKIK